MRKSMLLVFLVIVTIHTYAQVEIYSTYDDYKNSKSLVYAGVSEIKAWSDVMDFKSDKKIKIVYKDIWGFKFKNTFFRVIGTDIVALINEGKITYWENGIAILEQLSYPNKKKILIPEGGGMFFYISKSKDSQVFDADNFRKLLIANSEYYKLVKCVFDNYPEEHKKKIKMLNKVYGLGGTDETAIFIVVAKSGEKIDIVRDCISKFNSIK